MKKLQAILAQLELTLAIQQVPKSPPPDFIRMACTTTSVSYKNPLTVDELIQALLTGKVPAGEKPHLRALLDEAAPSLLKGIVLEAGRWSRPGKAEKNLARIARDIGASRRIEDWLNTA
ncbi:MAG: hypothetical protein AABZ67_05120 [Pseudomonadota bacterium]